MSGLAWNWLAVPYIVCAAALVAVGLAAALIRGDRVLRLGAVGAATTALPWALCSGLVTFVDDPVLATQLLRLGNGPVAIVGPSLLLVMLGVSGQLERTRWIARGAGLLGLVLLILCWTTDWTVPGAQRLGSGIFYPTAGPLSGIHFSSMAIWLAAGLVIARRSSTGGERRRLLHMLLTVLALGSVGATDLLLVYDVAGSYPIAWLPATIAALMSLYYVLRSDLLRPQGLDRDVAVELVAFVVVMFGVIVLLVVLDGAAPVALAALTSLVWTVSLGFAWTRTRERPVRIANERALGELVASFSEIGDDEAIAQRLAALWARLGIHVRVLDRVGPGARELDPEVEAWLVRANEALAAGDLNTMILGALRPRLEALFADGATLIVPLADRGTLVGLVEADHAAALREDERFTVIESARAAARALTYVALADTAARERETAREVEVAEAMRLQASASRDDELGRWAVASEYRTAVPTTGASWSATLLDDGRLALLVTEAQAHGVAAALATAAVTGAFAAATATAKHLELDDLLASLRASAEGVVRGGEPVAAFLAILDGEARTIAWACAGHPGAAIVRPAAPRPELAGTPRPDGDSRETIVRAPVDWLGGGGASLGASLVVATRGTTPLPDGAVIVVASSGMRRDDARLTSLLQISTAAGQRLAHVLVEHARAHGDTGEDLLAVIVRRR